MSGPGCLRQATTLLCLFAHTIRGGAATADIERFVAKSMEDSGIPGVAFLLIENGRIAYSRGFGKADLEHGTVVDPETTLFRVASVSKLVTATAILQLYERGLVRLDDDVNRYLKGIRVDDRFPQPVTLAHLLTHTAGFDERAIGVAATSPAQLAPLGEYLAHRMPPRVRPPGDVIAYSNHGYALLGYVVECVTGQRFERYVDQHIFRPLGMEHSSFDPGPDALRHLATGYVQRRGRLRPVPFDYLQIGPAGAMVSTASDISRFMQVHINGGTSILSEPSIRLMHTQSFAAHDKVAGYALGFYERLRNGRRVLLHDGDMLGFSSRLLILPEERLGFFVATNRQNLSFRERLTEFLLDGPPKRATYDTLDPESHSLAGSYRSTRAAQTSLEKVNAVFTQFRVTVDGANVVTVNYPRSFRGQSQWIQQGDAFRRTDAEEYMAVRRDAAGRVTHLFLSVFGVPFALERVGWFDATIVQALSMIGFAFLFLSPFPFWLRERILARVRKRLPAPMPAALGIVCGLNVLFMIVLALAPGEVDPVPFTHGAPWPLIALLSVPFFTGALAVWQAVRLVIAWRRRDWRLSRRLHYSLVIAAALAFLPYLDHWNLLGFKY